MTEQSESKIIDEEELGYWTPAIDHSQDIEIRKTKDGRIFAIKNIRQEFKDNIMIIIADISGDEEAAKEYLKQLGERFWK